MDTNVREKEIDMKNTLTSDNIFGDGDQVFIVAEIGKNFIQTKENRPPSEYLANAKQLIKAAKDAGADAVKFQTHNLEDEQLNIVIRSPHFAGSDRYSWVKRNTEATPLEFWRELKAYADSLDIIIFTTPMSRGAAQRVASFYLPIWKVSSGDLCDFVLLDYLAQSGKPIIISTGMSTVAELDQAVGFLHARRADFSILHCVSKYPCPADELYLDTIPYLAKRYGGPVGVSDHSIGHRAAVAAVGKGASIIEKHFSFSRDLWGPDNKASMTPDEFDEMVRAIRARERVSETFGAGVKQLDEAEAAFRPIFRKSLVAGANIPAGTILTPELVYAMRPQLSQALPSQAYEEVIGRRLVKTLAKYDPITYTILE